jgi:hypothetical protein
MLYEKYLEEEEADMEKERRRMEESMLMLDCMKLEKEIAQK